uniref:Sulfotransferase n=1 Tax=Branchiostoma floridae TaxID=7739 RepID=C3ZFF8_BRAFL|eukprot:XP_002592701.1 hypothetical protein BRAFLDRAFT_67141 [Branchiostoma floridae]
MYRFVENIVTFTCAGPAGKSDLWTGHTTPPTSAWKVIRQSASCFRRQCPGVVQYGQNAPSATLFYFRGARFPSPPVSPQGLELVESFEVRDDDVFVSASLSQDTDVLAILLCFPPNTYNCTVWPPLPRPTLPGLSSPYGWHRERSLPHSMKTHLPYNMLPKQAREGKGKIVYCARNPKDVVVSEHNMGLINDYLQPLSWEESLHEFLSALPANLWWNVISEYWRHKDDANLLFIKYEDMKKDLRGHVVKIAEFLGRSLTDEQTDEVTANCTFAAMKENLATNYSRDPVLKEKEFKRGNETGIEFIRKGQVGDWRNWFSPQQLEAFEAFDREKMAGTDLTFEDED